MPRYLLLVAFAGLAALWSLSSAAAEPRRAEFGLECRIPWTGSRLVGSPDPPPKYVVERVFPSLVFDQPEEMTAVPGTDRLLVAEVKGQLYTFPNRPGDGSVQRELFADLTKLRPDVFRVYGTAFHPQFSENRYCYVAYVLKPDQADGTHVSRFKVTATEPPTLDLGSEEVVITWMGGGHNGAHLQFGPDGYLYISTGDSGQSFPPDGRNTGQDIRDLEASILRIDVDRPQANRPYTIPADNPFVDRPEARGEVWAYGLRNPWKMCFDPADGSLWVGDVGWEMWEMIYRIERGGNYGWSLVEGRQPVHHERAAGPTPVLPPTVEHDHTEARSITGGYFYGGTRLPELRGAYVYGDYVTGKVWAVRHEAGRVVSREELLDSPLQIVSFGRDHAGEIYLVDYAGGIYRLAPNPRQGMNAEFPKKLSDTGLFASTAEHRPAAGVVPYGVNAEPWADGTTAERFVALPGTSQLGTYKKTDVQIGFIAGEWEFPSGGVLAKTVSIELKPGDPKSRRRLETQVLQYDVDTWRAYNYVWNEAQTDAVLAEAGFDQTLQIVDPEAEGGRRQQTWHHASRNECLLCHTTRAGSIHGFRLPQLAREFDYGNVRADQLRTLEHIGLFAEPMPPKIDAFPSPYDTSADVNARARAYLHVNCAHCHRRGGGGSAFFDVQYTLPLEKTGLVDARPTQGTFNIHDARIVAPGDPFRSVLYYRMMKLGHGRMPQFGSQVVDDEGTRLIRDWTISISRQPYKEGLVRIDLRNANPSDDEYKKKLIADLLATPHGAIQLVSAVESFKLPGALREYVVTHGTAATNPLVRDLFERYVPEEKRIKRLGSAIKPDDVLRLTGDAARGRALFSQSTGMQCRNCHKHGVDGRDIGPDLTMIGRKLDRAKLLESLLEPSRTIDPKFVAQMIETTDGRVLTGLVTRQNDREVVLRDAKGDTLTVSAAEIERLVPQRTSLMPELLLRDLTPQQAADLLEFLSSSK